MSDRPAALERTDGVRLAQLAVEVLAAYLCRRPFTAPPPPSERLGRPGATFVTLECAGALRGCVGTVDPIRPLWSDVIHNAVRAAVDPRLPAVTVDDWPVLDLKLSVLGPREPIPATGIDELAAQLRPGVDGLVLADEGHRATFLPAVWAKLADPADFVAALLRKGGWPAREWPLGLCGYRYTAVEFHDRAPRDPLPA